MQERHDPVIKDGLVVGSKGMKRVDIGVKDGKIFVGKSHSLAIDSFSSSMYSLMTL